MAEAELHLGDEGKDARQRAGQAAVTPAGKAGRGEGGQHHRHGACAGEHVIHGIRGARGEVAHGAEPGAEDVVGVFRVVHAGGDVARDDAERGAVDGEFHGVVVEPVHLVADAAGVVVGAFHFGAVVWFGLG
jgi:hypothetical protein